MTDKHSDPDADDPLAEAKRIMGNLARTPPKPHNPPSAPKPKARAARKGRVHKTKSRS
jgi:hypothetical protein